jgi:hypothetical protein
VVLILSLLQKFFDVFQISGIGFFIVTAAVNPSGEFSVLSRFTL